MPYDLFASEQQYLDHLLPVWRALPEAERDRVYLAGRLSSAARDEGLVDVRIGYPPPAEHPILVASFQDCRSAAHARRATVYVEHGAGQTYDSGDVEHRGHPSYSGSAEHDGVVLFLCPNETVADRWRVVYPHVPAVAVGCPKLDPYTERPPTRRDDTVAVSFHCFPDDVVVSGPPIVASGSRWYEGDLLRVTIATGDEVACTPNHPILTPRGWVAAGLLRIGDDVIGCAAGQRVVGRVDPNDLHGPARIQDVLGAPQEPGSMPAVCVPTSPEDFHGDGVGSEVHVVRTHGQLGDHLQPTVAEPAPQEQFVCCRSSCAARLKGPHLLGEGLRGPTFGGMDAGRFCEPGSPHSFDLDRNLECAQLVRLGLGANYLSRAQEFVDGAIRHAEVGSDLWPGRTSGVQSKHMVFQAVEEFRSTIDLRLLPRLDTLPPENVVDRRSADAVLSGKVGAVLARQVSAHKVINIDRQSFSGYVHSLQTTEGWHLANGIVVSNSDVRWVPETTSAWNHYLPGLPAVVARLNAEGLRVLGHAHPRLFDRVAGAWETMGAVPTRDFADVLRLASVYAIDNSSTLYEAAAVGIPVVAMNAPWYRRDVHHGLRFWNLIPGETVDEPDELADAILAAAWDPPEAADRRRRVTAEVYAGVDGKAAARAAEAVLTLI